MNCLSLVGLLFFLRLPEEPPKTNCDVLAPKAIEVQPSNSESSFRIAGKCVDQSGKPIDNAIIELYENDRTKKTVRSGTDGAVDLGSVIDPELSAEGYVHYVVVGRVKGTAIGTALPFGYSEKPSDLKIVLGAAGQLRGKITGPDGSPVSGAHVSVAGIPRIDGVHGDTTNAAGEYVLDSIPLLEHPGCGARSDFSPKSNAIEPQALVWCFTFWTLPFVKATKAV